MNSRWPLRVLAIFLFAWEPLRIATELPLVLPSLAMRGMPAVIELAAHALVAAIAVAAAWSLWTDAPHGVALASIALALSAAITVQSLYWSHLPRHTMPGDQLPLALAATAHAGAWAVYLLRVRARERQEA